MVARESPFTGLTSVASEFCGNGEGGLVVWMIDELGVPSTLVVFELELDGAELDSVLLLEGVETLLVLCGGTD